jgi:hypothetical protein
MSTLQDAARELLHAWEAWQYSGAVCADSQLLEALDALQEALAEPSTDELLSRLTHPPNHELRITYGTTWMARISGSTPQIYELSEDPAAALRAVLLRLPAPTEPCPDDEDSSGGTPNA